MPIDVDIIQLTPLNSSISCWIFGIVTKTGRPNSAASFSQQIKPASAEVRQIFSAWDVHSVKADRGVGLAPLVLKMHRRSYAPLLLRLLMGSLAGTGEVDRRQSLLEREIVDQSS